MDKYIFIEGFSTDKVLEEKALKIKNKEAMAQSIVTGRF